MTVYERRYFLARDAAVIAKFLAKHAAWSEAIALYQMDADRHPFPKQSARPSEAMKDNAYGAAGSICRLLNAVPGMRASTVADLSRTYALAIEAYNK